MSAEGHKRRRTEAEAAGPAVIYLIRHGDRHDYANPAWKDAAATAGNRPEDPPLSVPLGMNQATELAQHLGTKSRPVTRLLCSPYLRCIQTALPTAAAFKLPIQIEHGLAETGHRRQNVRTARDRFAYFAQVNCQYSSLHPEPSFGDPAVKEVWPEGYFARMKAFAPVR